VWFETFSFPATSGMVKSGSAKSNSSSGFISTSILFVDYT
jgi:hypothetical protein